MLHVYMKFQASGPRGSEGETFGIYFYEGCSNINATRQISRF